MHNIRRGLAGRREKGVVWRDSDRSINIRKRITCWLSVIERFSFESVEDKERVKCWTGADPCFFWLKSDGVPVETLLARANADIKSSRSSCIVEKRLNTDDLSRTIPVAETTS